jgi:hypothetical protein
MWPILEVDLQLSPHSWRWLKAAVHAYGDDERISGLTLQCADPGLAKCLDINVGRPENVGHFTPSAPGDTPTPKRSTRFRAGLQSLPADSMPIPGRTPTEWYTRFEDKETAKQVGGGVAAIMTSAALIQLAWFRK